MPAEATQSFESFLTSLAAHFTANGGLNVNSTSLHKLALMITGLFQLNELSRDLWYGIVSNILFTFEHRFRLRKFPPKFDDEGKSRSEDIELAVWDLPTYNITPNRLSDS